MVWTMTRLLAAVALLQVGDDPSGVLTSNIPQPIKDNLEGDIQMCREQGGRVVLRPPYIQEGDFDGDGRTDYLIDQEAVQCTTAASLYCGNSPCTVFAFLAYDGHLEPHHLPDDIFEPVVVTQGPFSAVETAGVDAKGTPTRLRWMYRDGQWRSAVMRRAN